MLALSLTTLLLYLPLTRFRRFLFSLLPGSARQSTFWEIQLELALSTTSARSYFSLFPFCLAQRGEAAFLEELVKLGKMARYSFVLKYVSEFYQFSQKGQPLKFPRFLSCLDCTSPLQEELLRLDKLEQEVPLELMVEKAEAKREQQS